MIYIIYKMLVLIKTNLNFLKDSIFECFLKECKTLLIFLEKLILSIKYDKWRFNFWRRKYNYRNKNSFYTKKKELNYTTIKDIRNLSRQKEETKPIKNRILRNIKNLFKHEEKENYYKPVRVSNFWSNNYIEYESNSDRSKALSVEEYLNKIRPYQLTI